MDSLSKGQARGQELAHRPWVGEHEESCSSELAPGLEAVSISRAGDMDSLSRDRPGDRN